MQITLTVRHGDIPESLKDYVREEVAGLAKYFERLVEADIILEQESHRHNVEVRIHSSNDTHFAGTSAGDWRTAIDRTVAKLGRQLKRHKEKLLRRTLTRDERQRFYGRAPISGAAPEPDSAAAPLEWDRISSREAISRLASSGEEVLVFVDTEDGVVKIARRDEEGSVSVVEAEAFELEER